MSKTQLKTRMIHGREYVEVNERLKYFRQSFPGFRIRTKIVSMQNEEIVMSAAVMDPEGNVVSVGHAHEEKSSSRINNTSYVENCETSAIGRALGILGIGIDGGVATAEEVEMAIAKQEREGQKINRLEERANHRKAKADEEIRGKQAPSEQQQPEEAQDDLQWMAGELFNAEAAKINAYLRSIGWLNEGLAFSDLPADKLKYAVDNHEALLAEADKLELKSNPEVRNAVARSVGKGGAA